MTATEKLEMIPAQGKADTRPGKMSLCILTLTMIPLVAILTRFYKPLTHDWRWRM